MKIIVNDVEYNIQKTRVTEGMRDGIRDAAKVRVTQRHLPAIDKHVRKMITLVSAAACARAGLGTLADGLTYIETVSRMTKPLNDHNFMKSATFYNFKNMSSVYVNINGCSFEFEKGSEFIGELPDAPSTGNYDYRYARMNIGEDNENRAAFKTALELAEMIKARDAEIDKVHAGLAPILATASVKKLIESFPEVITLYPALVEAKPKVAMPAPINMTETKDLLGL